MVGRPPDYVFIVSGIFAISCVVWISHLYPGEPEGDTALADLITKNSPDTIDLAHNVSKNNKSTAISVNSTAAIIWLHGLGDSPTGSYTTFFKHRMTEGGGLEHVEWITPAAPMQKVTSNNGKIMASWFDILTLPVSPASPKSPENSVMLAVATVHSLIENCVSRGINSSRVVIGGFSQGGATSIVSALAYPGHLGGAAVLWGWVPLSEDRLASIVTNEAKTTPIVWSHGDEDKLVVSGNGVEGCRLLQELGLKCDLHVHKGQKHHPVEEEAQLLRQWIRDKLPQV